MKTVLITGCNRGLGLAILRKYAAEGYNIIACIRKENVEFTKVCNDIEKENNIKIKQIYFELTDSSRIETAMAHIESMDIEIDVLVNNAGINVMKPLLFTEYEDLLQSFQINYFAPVLITKAVASIMMRQGHGSIVNITSMGSLGHQPGGAIYDASKAALNQLTITAAQELAPLGIRVNAVACGPINTDMFTTMPEKVQKKLTKATALGRAAETEEITNFIYTLSTEQASYLTGQIIRLDGGAII